jgi:GNAT superfamily N-acetyltransferase
VPATIRVRPAREADTARILDLVRELAAYEREPDAVTADEDDLRTALFGPSPLAHALVAEVRADGAGDRVDDSENDSHGDCDGGSDSDRDGDSDGDAAEPSFDVVGTAIWFVTFSTWRGRHGIWLEDLYVRPGYRGLGLGRALLAELAAQCGRRGYPRLEWNVLDWNTPALEFYRRLGAQPLDEWTVHRLSGEPLARLGPRPYGHAERSGDSTTQ